MELKFYGQSYEDLTLVVEKYNRMTDVYVCSVEGDVFDEIGWVIVDRDDILIEGIELIATVMKYVGTQETVDQSIH